MARHVLISGGAGYIGSILTEYFLERGDGVEARITLRDGLQKTFGWYRANRAQARNNVAAE